MPASTFTLDAYLVGGRVRHSREHDHTGYELDSVVVLESAIGPYAAGTPLSSVLLLMFNRLTDLERTQFADRIYGSFVMDAWIGYYFSVDAVILGSASGTFTIDATITRGGRFTIDALIAGGSSFTIDALIVL